MLRTQPSRCYAESRFGGARSLCKPNSWQGSSRRGQWPTSVSAFFALAYRIRRQEPEYLVFAAASVALSISTAGAAVA